MSFSPGSDEPQDGIVAEINVTPLTDIFLVLLIIFMVTSTALIQQGAPVNLPKASAGVAAPSGVVVTVTAERKLAVNGKPVDLGQLEGSLREALRLTSERSVILQGDRHVILEDAVRIMTVAKTAGAEKLSIATEPEAIAAPPPG